MMQYSDAAWNVASQWSYLLASETRDLAREIDLVIKAQVEAQGGTWDWPRKPPEAKNE